MKLDRIEKTPEIGDYVFCSRWGDRSPSDPWEIGILEEILMTDNKQCYRVAMSKSPQTLTGIRLFSHCQVINHLQGVLILGFYPSLEGTDWRTWNERIKTLKSKSVINFFKWFLNPKDPTEED